MTTNITMLPPICPNCGVTVWAGDVVEVQGGPHVLCDDPMLLHHTRKFRSGEAGQCIFGYVNDNGESVWL